MPGSETLKTVHAVVQLVEEWKFPTTTEHRRCARVVFVSSTHVHESYWDDRDFNLKKRSWGSADTLRIYTLGFCDKNEEAGTPEKSNRVWYMMVTFPTCLASGNTGLMLAMWLPLWCPKYTAFQDWADLSTPWVSRTGNNRSVGGRRKRKVMPSECQESRQFSEGYPQFSDELGYRVAGNAAPVPYFTAFLTSVVQALTKAGVQKHTGRSKNALDFEDLPLVESAKVTLGPKLEVFEEIQRAHSKFVQELFTAAKSAVIKQGPNNGGHASLGQATWHQCIHGWVCLQPEAKLGPSFDCEICIKPICIEPIREKQ